LGLYFVTDGNIDRFSQTGLLGTCIRRIIKGEPVKIHASQFEMEWRFFGIEN
jgi:hypothetical protein